MPQRSSIGWSRTSLFHHPRFEPIQSEVFSSPAQRRRRTPNGSCILVNTISCIHTSTRHTTGSFAPGLKFRSYRRNSVVQQLKKVVGNWATWQRKLFRASLSLEEGTAWALRVTLVGLGRWFSLCARIVVQSWKMMMWNARSGFGPVYSFWILLLYRSEEQGCELHSFRMTLMFYLDPYSKIFRWVKQALDPWIEQQIFCIWFYGWYSICFHVISVLLRENKLGMNMQVGMSLVTRIMTDCILNSQVFWDSLSLI